ncbi:putative glutamine amidotransferase [Virgibacillus natechei]|uniref:Glutamine amidotransferase n=1 Tax=Virgibacillus natechei TaxID=1216297 RepID=A0ABS4IHL1_9BACI|nr:gamma-glutamyl-gamma-aminobutyrate hydrolase family protein [Virgibacillus natechei]MBP1970439.1 putative glutamine amidotransferase [Virgibacillus natechei]UZD13909.1 gamma-glutamyl-gamma-aminobutyrate hydrolase family protein [Virgibacillus natechei]
MKPLIGITSSMEVDQSHYAVANRNVEAILRAGGMPVMLPYFLEEGDVDQIANQIDGLYATGGYDIDPTLFGEEPHPNLGTIIPARDQSEIILMTKLIEMGKPILGVCRGAQTLNIAAGGDMYQDIYAQINQELLQHSQKAPRDHGSHFVYVSQGSLLHKLTGSEKFRVNSMHHQANRDVSGSFQISGKASDGVVEAVESKKHPFALGLQWHPEAMATTDDVASLNIYEGFIAACGK